MIRQDGQDPMQFTISRRGRKSRRGRRSHTSPEVVAPSRHHLDHENGASNSSRLKHDNSTSSSSEETKPEFVGRKGMKPINGEGWSFNRRKPFNSDDMKPTTMTEITKGDIKQSIRSEVKPYNRIDVKAGNLDYVKPEDISASHEVVVATSYTPNIKPGYEDYMKPERDDYYEQGNFTQHQSLQFMKSEAPLDFNGETPQNHSL